MNWHAAIVAAAIVLSFASLIGALVLALQDETLEAQGAVVIAVLAAGVAFGVMYA